MNQEPYMGEDGQPLDLNLDPKKTESKGFAIASMVLGIVALVCCCLSELSLICSVLAIVFAIVSRRRNSYFDGMSTAGLVCGIIAAALAIVSIVDAILNPISDAEVQKMLEEYLAMLEQLAGGEEGTPVFFFLPR